MVTEKSGARLLTPSEFELWELAKAVEEPWGDKFEMYGYHGYGTSEMAYIAGADPLTISSLLETLEKTRVLLSELADPDECRYDHHGDCQTHLIAERPCPHERARSLLSGFSGEGER